jgi:hypothetical protein
MEIACISNSVSSWGCWPFIACWCRLYRRWKWNAVVQLWYIINTLSWSAPQCTLSPLSFKIYLKMRYKHILETVFDPDMNCTWSQPMQRNFYLLFYCFSKKYCWNDDEWRLQFLHISSHSQVIALSIFWIVTSRLSVTWDNGNNKKVWYLGEYLIKFNETWYT